MTNYDVPLFHQYDDRWANHSFGDGTLSTDGSIPTCIAMVLAWHGKNVTPDVVADFFDELTDEDFFVALKDKFGVEFARIDNVDDVENILSRGIPLIATHSTGIFSDTFVVYAHLDDYDRLAVNDPAAPLNSNKNADNHVYSFSEISAGISNAWYPVTPRDEILIFTEPNFDYLKNKSPEDFSSAEESRYIGFEITHVDSENLNIVMLPKNKTYCEPIYPDYCVLPYFV